MKKVPWSVNFVCVKSVQMLDSVFPSEEQAGFTSSSSVPDGAWQCPKMNDHFVCGQCEECHLHQIESPLCCNKSLEAQDINKRQTKSCHHKSKSEFDLRNSKTMSLCSQTVQFAVSFVNPENGQMVQITGPKGEEWSEQSQLIGQCAMVT